ncbi:transglycosylase SLT domain-containing protein [Priestia megaterium]|uniref:transglycosylase SLT domain-containing protein n=1 Tax=Priestia megaterium TaxID=1404 RepID=UPI001A947CD9|nr:transglycosylase SLT domain-containing protein [Priestia megaterium]QSX21714.1 transglycosylase SLT domain-containing protein [Priestia megaterium]
MKVILMGVALLTCLALGWFHGEAFAEVEQPSQCASYGEIKQKQNPSLQHVNCLLTNAALEANIPPEVVKAVATKESGATEESRIWSQFDNEGKPRISQDGGIGLMQITNHSTYDQERLKYDIYYNIQAGVQILSNMYSRTDLPKIKGAGRETIENWYFPVMAYNGIKPVNSPLYQFTGERNTEAYQEKVFALIEYYSFVDDPKLKLGKFPFATEDFSYDVSQDENIKFLKKEYTLTDELHSSAYNFVLGNKVTVTGDVANLRSQPGTPSDASKLVKGTTLIVDGDFKYNQDSSSERQFVWYPVSTLDQQLTGYISSAYLMKSYIPGKVTKVSMSTDKASPQTEGTPITMTATSEGSSDPEYRFYVRDEKGTLTMLQEYGTSNKVTWTPQSKGTYTLIVHAKDKSKSGANSYYEARAEKTYQVEAGKVTKVTMSTDKASPQTEGTPITVTATSEGSSDPEYRFYVRDEKGTLTMLQEYGTSNKVTWTPQSKGTYTLIVHAKDKSKSGANSYYEARAEKTYQVEAEKVTKVSMSTDMASPQTEGTPITVTATSEGSSDPEYRFYVRDEKGTLTTLQEYGTSNKVTWIPQSKGTYTLIVHAKDKSKSGANSYYEARIYTAYTIK